MQNYFETLNDALDSEGLLSLWPISLSVGYGESVGFAVGGKWISIYRCDSGRYERPVHYATQMEDSGVYHLTPV